MYQKYYCSDVFNVGPLERDTSTKGIRVRTSQPCLEKTSNDIFNTGKVSEKEIKPQKSFKGIVKRQDDYNKIYGSDIFCQNEEDKSKLKKSEGVKKIRNVSNFSNCFEGMKNNKEYVEEIKNYEKDRRAPKKEYNPEKYIHKESAAERYFKEIYDDKNGIFPQGKSNYTDTSNDGKEEDKGAYLIKVNYAKRRRHLKKQLSDLNDCGADRKKSPGEHIGQYKENDKKQFNKKNVQWTEKNSGGYNYFDSKENSLTLNRINKQIYLQSNLFKDNKNPETSEENAKKLKKRIEEEKQKEKYLQKVGFTTQYPPKRDLSNNDRSLWGAVHSKWEKANMDWRSPEAELMFSNEFYNGINQNYGPKGPTAFQRKINQLADTKNKDTINEQKRVPIVDLKRQPTDEKVHKNALDKIEKVIDEIPNVKEDKKKAFKMYSTTFKDDDWDKKAKTLNKFYSSANFRKKKPYTIKVTQKQDLSAKDGFNTNNDFDYHNYVLTYSTKKGNPFEKFDEGDIKKMFGSKGLHIYNIRKNQFNKGDTNTINFRVRENAGETGVQDKIKTVQDELSNKEYKIMIEKEPKKNIKKNLRNYVSLRGTKRGMVQEIGNQNAVFKKVPPTSRIKHAFSNQFAQIDYGYKKASP